MIIMKFDTSMSINDYFSPSSYLRKDVSVNYHQSLHHHYFHPNANHNHHHSLSIITIKYHSIIQFITLFISKYIWPKWTKHRCSSKNYYLLSLFFKYFQFQTNRLLFLLCLLLCSLPNFALSECKFPEHWWGSWFQKGVSDTIYITSNNISEKGICRQNNSEKYLIENRNDKCVRCLVISERHPNILQYKETSYCYPLSELSFDICFEINGDAPLYSLFRVNTSPIKCPFTGPFTFSYSRGINECKDPFSTINECTDDRHMLFKFRACIDIPGSESRVEQLECIADWKEGSIKYLVGKLNHQLATTNEDRFRCFIIEKNNSDSVESYNIGQSGEASCEGLFSPRDGSRTFKLRKAHQVKPICDFPPWLTEPIRWTTLDNRHVYDFSALNQFTVTDLKKEVFRNAKCILSDDVSFLYPFNTSRFIIHTTLQCSSGYACMHAYQRNERISELQIGKIVPDQSDACLPINFPNRPSDFITLTTLDQETQPCELSGIYSIRTKLLNQNAKITNYSRLVSLLDSRFMCQEKALKLKSNCDEPNLFQFICTTDNRVKNFYCRGGWKENNTQFMLLSLKSKFNYEYCIAYNTKINEIRLIRNSHFCYRSNEINDNINNNNNNNNEQDWSDFRPMANMDSLRYPPSRYDDSVSFTLINNEGSCHRSGSASFYVNHLCHLLLMNTIIIMAIFVQNVIF